MWELNITSLDWELFSTQGVLFTFFFYFTFITHFCRFALLTPYKIFMRRCYVWVWTCIQRAWKLKRDTKKSGIQSITLNGKTKHSNMATGNLQEKHPQHNYYCYFTYHTIQRCFFSRVSFFCILISVYFEQLMLRHLWRCCPTY